MTSLLALKRRKTEVLYRRWPQFIISMFSVGVVCLIVSPSQAEQCPDGFILTADLGCQPTELLILNEKTCPNIDLSDHMATKYYQGTEETCASVVAAKLIEYSQALPRDKQVSALDVQVGFHVVDIKEVQKALDHNGDWNTSRSFAGYYGPKLAELKELNRGDTLTDKLLTGTVASTLLMYLGRGGICTESQLPQIPLAELEANSPHLSKAAILLNANAQNKSVFPKAPDFKMPASNKAVLPPAVDCPKSLRLDSMEGALTLSQQLNEKTFSQLNLEIEKRCQPRIPLKPYSLSGGLALPPGRNSKSALFIAGELARERPRPIGITYDPSFLVSGGRSKFKQGSHASVVVGSRWKNGRCQFRVQNNSGLDCKFYAKPFNDKDHCVEGDVWVDSSLIKQNVIEFVSVNPTGK